MIRKLLLATSTLLAATLAQAQDINFGIISTESASHLKADWAPILADMEAKTGYKVKAFFANDYTGIIEAMRFNKVQMAWMGNKSGMEAVDRAGGEVFAQTSYADGALGYHSLLITHKESGIKSVEQVLKSQREYNYGAGDPQSTSGTLVPGYYLYALNGIDPKTHYKSSRSGNHESNLMATAAKQVDVAITNTEVWEKFQKREAEKAKNIQILWKSPLIAADPMLWRADLPADMKAKLKTFFMSYGRGESEASKRELANLAKLTFGVFNESSNKQLVPFRQLELFKDKAKLENDDKLDPAAKQAKLAEIQKKLAELNAQLAQAK
ncbi:phosphonate ABC transporter substrate-binding protein [Paucibacter sp. DJ1R-11]|uniref:phosphonate ABC transporter substrate-binding protein n=1 Tax=unclassified Roseateles TaxID=2626991 RepID=UPI0021E4FA36|nr:MULTISPECIES: phosphonate ABC transporter substrate-binding protein [unclassified Roseateles]MCV2363403.1 phosphonate ABC transporter substrate-binding protein [Paucibacter sp. DJ1R-11]MCV2421531.1 phosphonate ABC transporter substrate-binding protein [Paucibacter sp. DJ4R-1]MCV2438236.1 phosphonate ABC transporter substrate-binding protein [Paucibacter sp. DJ2R-2]